MGFEWFVGFAGWVYRSFSFWDPTTAGCLNTKHQTTRPKSYPCTQVSQAERFFLQADALTFGLLSLFESVVKALELQEGDFNYLPRMLGGKGRKEWAAEVSDDAFSFEKFSPLGD